MGQGKMRLLDGRAFPPIHSWWQPSKRGMTGWGTPRVRAGGSRTCWWLVVMKPRSGKCNSLQASSIHGGPLFSDTTHFWPRTWRHKLQNWQTVTAKEASSIQVPSALGVVGSGRLETIHIAPSHSAPGSMLYLSANPRPVASEVALPNLDQSPLFPLCYLTENSLWGFVFTSFRFPVTRNIRHHDIHPLGISTSLSHRSQTTLWEEGKHCRRPGATCSWSHLRTAKQAASSLQVLLLQSNLRCFNSAPFPPVLYLARVECFWLFFFFLACNNFYFFSSTDSIFPKPRIDKKLLGIYTWLPEVHSPILQGSKLQGRIVGLAGLVFC